VNPTVVADIPERLPGVLHSLEPTLNHLGYAAVVGLVFVEDFGVPVPGETVLVLAAVYAGAGRLNVFVVGLLGLVAAVAGDNLGFAIGRFGGRPLVDRYGRYIFVTHVRVERATRFIARHGGGVIVAARFVVGLRQANGIIAGMGGIPWARFLAFNTVGAALWVATWTSVGYFSGRHINGVYDAISTASIYASSALGALLVARGARRVARARRGRRKVAS